MKGAYLIIVLFAVSILVSGCYTAVGVAGEDQSYNTAEYYDEKSELNQVDNLTSGYFDEESEELYDEDYYSQQNDVYYQESTVDFFTIFSEALSGFISSGSLNVLIDLSSDSSNNSGDSSNSDNYSRNNSGSRNYDRR